jgi:hypothetical protein
LIDCARVRARARACLGGGNPGAAAARGKEEANEMTTTRAPARWTEYAHLRFTGRDPRKPKVDKTRTAELIREAGVRGPEVYGVFDRAEDVDFGALPPVFVLKPTGLNGKRGVMLLTRRTPARPLKARIGDVLRRRPPPEPVYWDAMQRRELTRAAIVAEQQDWAKMHRRREPLRLIAEELIVGENGAGRIPFDYKVYVFAGEPAFVLQLDRNVSPPGAAFFDGDFRPMAKDDPRVTHGPKTQRAKPVVPRCAADILDTAARLSRALATPFVSVDCYATARGAVVGEITVIPGGPYARSAFSFSEAYDLEMGARWTAALARLGEPVPIYDERWTDEERRVSGLPLKAKKKDAEAEGAKAGSAEPRPAAARARE